MAVKREHKEAMRNVQEEMNLHQQKGDQQNQSSTRVPDNPLKKHFSCFLQNIKDQMHTELQETEIRMKAKQKKLEEELKIIREKQNPLLQSVQKQVSETAIASAVTKLLLSALLAFPLWSSGGGVMPLSAILL